MKNARCTSATARYTATSLQHGARARASSAVRRTQKTDLEGAYLIGIRDGFRLARAGTQAEAEDLIAEIKADMNAKMRAVQTELAHRRTSDDVETERDPATRLH